MPSAPLVPRTSWKPPINHRTRPHGASRRTQPARTQAAPTRPASTRTTYLCTPWITPHLFEEAQYANGQRGGRDEGADHTLDELGSRFAISMRTSAICVVSPYRAGCQRAEGLQPVTVNAIALHSVPGGRRIHAPRRPAVHVLVDRRREVSSINWASNWAS